MMQIGLNCTEMVSTHQVGAKMGESGSLFSGTQLAMTEAGVLCT